MGSLMQREISFSHNGQTIRATLVDNPLSGGRTSEKICFICKHPLGDRPFYTTNPFEVYFHAQCFCAVATAAAPLPAFQSRSFSNNESRDIPYFLNNSHPYQTPNYPTYPPPPNYHYNHSSAYQAPNYPTYNQPPPNYYPHPHSSSPYQAPNYPTYQPPPNYYPPYQAPNYPTYQPPPNYYPHPHSSSHSSMPVWTGIIASTALESLMQPFFSSWFSNT